MISSSLFFLLGAFSCFAFYRIKKGSLYQIGNAIVVAAEKECALKKAAFEIELKEKQFANERQCEHVLQEHRLKIAKEEERHKARQEALEEQKSALEKRLSLIEKNQIHLRIEQEKLEEEKKKIDAMCKKAQADLEAISQITAAEAKESLLKKIESETRLESARLLMRLKKEAEEEANMQAAKILATAMNRLSSSCVTDVAITTVFLQSEEMKGRIIGREGRNIATLEHLTGVNLLIDDTPNAVVISGFDPLRKQIAKMALTELIQDGRIHPTRIEEAVKRAEGTLHSQVKEFGEKAFLRCGLALAAPEIIQLVGKLHFRSSFGQNVLEHSIEVSHLMGIMAAECGLDSALAKRIGLLHDMGKAASEQLEGSHAMVGYELALKYGEKEVVANGIGCHHNEIAPITIEGSLCNTADALSGGRPGARAEAIENYIKRLKKLEQISCQYEGVIKAYAMQAGREIRVIVEPDQLDDAATYHLARNLCKRIEQEVSYGGKIKVTVIREKRIIEYAT